MNDHTNATLGILISVIIGLALQGAALIAIVRAVQS